MNVTLEIFLLAVQKENQIVFHKIDRDITGTPLDPDQILLDILSDSGIQTNSEVSYIHSTSWRYDAGRTILTYVVWMKACSLNGFPTKSVKPFTLYHAGSLNPLSPRPQNLCEEHVLIHGLGHLSYLMDKRDKTIIQAICDADAIHCLRSFRPEIGGRIGDTGNPTARQLSV